jgi:hypothetical protein
VALALLASLFCRMAGLSICLRVCRDVQVNEAAANSELTIVWRDGLADGETRVELYPIDFAAVDRDFRANTRPGKSLDDYLGQRLKA